MADFESTWMSNQHGRNSPEPSVFWAGQKVKKKSGGEKPTVQLGTPVNLCQPHPLGPLGTSEDRFSSSAPGPSSMVPLGSPDPILLSLQLQVLPPAGDGDHPETLDETLVLPSAIACCSRISRIKIDKIVSPWFPPIQGLTSLSEGASLFYLSKWVWVLKAGSADSAHAQYQGSNFPDNFDSKPQRQPLL